MYAGPLLRLQVREVEAD